MSNEPVQSALSHSRYDLGHLRAGSLEVVIANRPEDIRAAQQLRYQVFFEEAGAPITPTMAELKYDADMYDDICDHLLVIDHIAPDIYKVVGTYRLIRREAMMKIGRFYSEAEYDISLIKNFDGEVLEVGRSCVHKDYRNRAAMQLLWRGIGAYVSKFDIEILFGCASFHGTDPKEHAMALSYLYHYHLAPPEMRTVALENRYIEMNCMPKEQVDVKRAFVSLPALIKGYLRLNGWIGLGAVIDHDVNTTDVSVIVKTRLVEEKYAHRYGAELHKNS